jgi:hypothetical protein
MAKQLGIDLKTVVDYFPMLEDEIKTTPEMPQSAQAIRDFVCYLNVLPD